MLFCVVRLGKDSKSDIHKINLMQGVQNDESSDNTIFVTCKQVPNEVNNSTYCFIWLGSDNNKGTPTSWKQGIKAFGRVIDRTYALNYNDDTVITIRLGIALERAINKIDLLKVAKEDYIDISNVPVIGLNTSSNQTVQLIRPNEENQNLRILFKSIFKYQGDLKESFKNRYLELESYIDSLAQQDVIYSENLEFEDTDDSSTEYKIPFDPNLIKLRRDPYTLGELIDRIEHEEINFLTGFQRKAGLWSDIEQSRLIESILLRLPLPAFYFEETEENVWQVIDGLQRTTALKRFIVDQTLRLKNLEFLREYNDFYFSMLPRDLNRRIRTTPLTVYVIEKGTPEEVKFNIFKRINTTGIVLTSQEIRHALNQGIPATFIAELAKSEDFKRATAFSIDNERMEDRELVNRFVAFYLFNFFEYEPDLDSFLSKGISKLNDISSLERDDLKKRFERSMRTAYSIFGNDAFRKRQKLVDRRRPINKALFEVVSVIFSQLNNTQIVDLMKNKEKFINSYIDLNSDLEFLSAISSGTGNRINVITRFSKFKDLVYFTLNQT